jgi:putative addiction module component (TIGR02574 family)
MSANLKVPPEFDSAANDERIAFDQELWDRIAEDPHQVPIPNEHREILEARLNAYAENPEPGRPWNEVRDELLAKLRSA